jgi:biopolymer transport protein ExbB
MKLYTLVCAYWIKGGWLLIPIACISFAIWYYLFTGWKTVKDFIRIPESVEDLFCRLASAPRTACMQWVDAIKKIDDHYGYIAGYMVQRMGKGDTLSEIMDEISSTELAEVEKNIGVLKALVVAAPLVGLLGTVFGMMETFQIISLKQGYISDLMAAGISKALITTQCGLVVALPGLFGAVFLKRMVRRARVFFSVMETHMHLSCRGEKG